MDDNQFEKSENLLKKALSLPRLYEESYKGESDQNILTTLGTLYSRQGLDHLKNEDPDGATQYFFKAEKCFVTARSGGFPNAHAYHAHAFMFFKRGLTSEDMKVRIEFFSESLKILELAMDNVNSEELQIMIELQTLVFDSLGRSSEVWENIHTLAEIYKSPKGYYLYADWIKIKALQGPESQRQLAFKQALSIVEDGLKIFANDESLLMLKAKLAKTIVGLPEYYKVLQAWYNSTLLNSSTPSLSLLSEYAIVSFKLGYYDQSKQLFQSLDHFSAGHRLKFKTEKPIENEDGTRRQFEGKIVAINDVRDGQIQVENLPTLKYPIRFRPLACYFTPSVGDHVSFKIAFSYVSPIAVELEKL